MSFELFERGNESSKKPPELGPLRFPDILRSPSRELFPNVLPSNSPLARLSLIGPAAHRGEPSSDRLKEARVPIGGGRCCSSEGDIESHARVVRWRQHSRGTNEVLDGHSRQRGNRHRLPANCKHEGVW